MRTLRYLVLLAVAPMISLAQSPGTTARPRLVLSIVVDQMRADYVDRFADLYTGGGFNLLAAKGAKFTNCNYVHCPTYTGPGHSTVLSGEYPGKSGIVANEWFDVRLNRSVYCMEDSSVQAVGTDPTDPEGMMSPKNFSGMTVGDELRASSPASKVIGIAIKDRASILPAGKFPTGAYWFDETTGSWITSSYYRQVLPAWLARLNAKRMPDSFLGKTWRKLLPDKAYERQGLDDAPGEAMIPGDSTRTFPHAVHDLSKAPYNRPRRRYAAILPTPFGNDLTVACAMAAIQGEQLGQRGVTDLLSISFSSPDYCGHLFGPDSHEIEDMYLRLDGQLATLFSYVDSVVGLNNTLIVLTGDHGVSPFPNKFPGEAMRMNSSDLFSTVKTLVGIHYGYNEGAAGILPAFENKDIYINYDSLRARGFDRVEFEKFVGEAALKQPGVALYFTRTELEKSIAAGGSTNPEQAAIEHSFNPLRSGGVLLLMKPHCFFGYPTDSTGTTHGSPYEYDTHVPFLLAGPGIAHGEYATASTPNDIAATLAKLLEVSAPPDCAGKARVEALQ
jgi:predicted AlkP superfamily pyrophosphatase or phosphodiesterase